MSKSKRRPSWILLYSLVALLFGLFLIETRLTMSGAAHRVVEIGIVLVIYFLVWLWVKANDAALIQEERDRRRAYRGEVLNFASSNQGLDRSPNPVLTVRQHSIRKSVTAWLGTAGFFR